MIHYIREIAFPYASQEKNPVDGYGGKNYFSWEPEGNLNGKEKAIRLQAWTGPEGCRRVRLMKVVRLSALCIYSP